MCLKFKLFVQFQTILWNVWNQKTFVWISDPQCVWKHGILGGGFQTPYLIEFDYLDFTQPDLKDWNKTSLTCCQEKICSVSFVINVVVFRLWGFSRQKEPFLMNVAPHHGLVNHVALIWRDYKNYIFICCKQSLKQLFCPTIHPSILPPHPSPTSFLSRPFYVITVNVQIPNWFSIQSTRYSSDCRLWKSARIQTSLDHFMYVIFSKLT